MALVVSEGTDILNNPSLANRAKRKVISRKMVLALIHVIEKKGETERKQAYRNAYHCQNKVIVSGSKMYGKYCKNRFCKVCSDIRKAEIINKYYPTLLQWDDVPGKSGLAFKNFRTILVIPSGIQSFYWLRCFT
jgi:hypothetical protein